MPEKKMILILSTLPLNNFTLSWIHQALDSEGPFLAHFSVVFPYLGRISHFDIWRSRCLRSKYLVLGKG